MQISVEQLVVSVWVTRRFSISDNSDTFYLLHSYIFLNFAANKKIVSITYENKKVHTDETYR